MLLYCPLEECAAHCATQCQGRKLSLASNVYLLKYPEIRWLELESQELFSRSHHSMHIVGSTAYIIGGYSWETEVVTNLSRFQFILFRGPF